METIATGRFVEADATFSRRGVRMARRERSVRITLDLDQRAVVIAGGSAPGETSIVLAGELDVATRPMLAEAITMALHRRPSRLTFDGRKLSFIDAGGVGLLVGASVRLRWWRGVLIVEEPAPAVLRVLTLCGLQHLVGAMPGRVTPPPRATLAA